MGQAAAGHPEGSVGAHVADLLETIDRWGETGERREELRFLALVHDSLKYRVQNWRAHTGENHHAMRARRFAERYTDDERLLATLEQHDRPYNLWRKAAGAGGWTSRLSARCSSGSPISTCSFASWSSTARPRARTTSRSDGCRTSSPCGLGALRSDRQAQLPGRLRSAAARA